LDFEESHGAWAHDELVAINAVTLTIFQKVRSTCDFEVLTCELGLCSLADVDHQLMVKVWQMEKMSPLKLTEGQQMAMTMVF
jgi:hypothetical protein